MQETADLALSRLVQIADEFRNFISANGKVSESDTRVKIVDRVLKEVCLWPESEISREDHVDSGFTDYQLKVRNAPYVVVEAKREGITFEVPRGFMFATPKLNGSLVTDSTIKSAIEQVRGYCDDIGARYAIATNGNTWIVFRSIRDDMPWRYGNARLFVSIDSIVKQFTLFWNLMSYPSICEGSLDAQFGRITPATRSLNRVTDRLYNADLPLQRNRLNGQLQPMIRYIFEDIASQNDEDLFRTCYVHSASLRITADDLSLVISDSVPSSLGAEGAQPLRQTENGAGEFGQQVEEAIRSLRGELYLLLGGIGCGKSTFIKRYQRLIAKDLLSKRAFVFNLDFLKAPLQPSELEPFIWSNILQSLRIDYADDELEQRKYVKGIFKEKLHNLGITVSVRQTPPVC
jgi:hypothetical protein